VDGRRVERAPIGTLGRVHLGDNGPVLLDTFENVSAVESVKEDEKIQVGPPSLENYQAHYFQDTARGNISEHTMMIRQAFKKVQKHQKKQFAAVIAGLLCLFIAAGVYALYKHQELRKVFKYIGKWKATPRLKRAIPNARENGYTAKIAEAFQACDLPPHFSCFPVSGRSASDSHTATWICITVHI
jgi:hypothetical protein